MTEISAVVLTHVHTCAECVRAASGKTREKKRSESITRVHVLVYPLLRSNYSVPLPRVLHLVDPLHACLVRVYQVLCVCVHVRVVLPRTVLYMVQYLVLVVFFW